MSASKFLQDYVKLMASQYGPSASTKDWSYPSPYHFLLHHGQEFRSAAVPQDGMEVLRRAVGRRHLPVKLCFSNAADVVLADTSGRLAYCEGWALRLIPVHHAWITLDKSIVLDVTWNHLGTPLMGRSLKNKVLGQFIEADIAYLGVRFSRTRLLQGMMETKRYDSILMDYGRDFPLLREEFNQELESATGVDLAPLAKD